MTPRVAVVTGGNRGIGHEIARQLATQGIETIVTSRDGARAEAAAGELAANGLPVTGRELDVTDPASVSRFAGRLASEPGRLDVLVNNAGILIDEGRSALDPDLALVQETLDTNLFGTWRLTAALAPLLRDGHSGRIVNVSSGAGQLDDMWSGYPGYRVSKTALNALTRMVAHELREADVLVNAMCPGWVRTDMGGSSAPRSVADGADTAVWLATLPAGGPTGGFFRDREPIPW